jgi:hypothetical protein
MTRSITAWRSGALLPYSEDFARKALSQDRNKPLWDDEPIAFVFNRLRPDPDELLVCASGDRWRDQGCAQYVLTSKRFYFLESELTPNAGVVEASEIADASTFSPWLAETQLHLVLVSGEQVDVKKLPTNLISADELTRYLKAWRLAESFRRGDVTVPEVLAQRFGHLQWLDALTSQCKLQPNEIFLFLPQTDDAVQSQARLHVLTNRQLIILSPGSPISISRRIPLSEIAVFGTKGGWSKVTVTATLKNGETIQTVVKESPREGDIAGLTDCATGIV